MTYYAGVWEQREGFTPWSRHKSHKQARRAATRYARAQTSPTGGALSWAGGVRQDGSDVTWFDKNGNERTRKDTKMETHEYTFAAKQDEIDILRIIEENRDSLVVVVKEEKVPPQYWVFSTQGDVLQDLGREDLEDRSIFAVLKWRMGFCMTNGSLRHHLGARTGAPGSVYLLDRVDDEETAHEVAREYVRRVRRAKNEKFRFRVTAYGE